VPTGLPPTEHVLTMRAIPPLGPLRLLDTTLKAEQPRAVVPHVAAWAQPARSVVRPPRIAYACPHDLDTRAFMDAIASSKDSCSSSQ
jgi:hypothetical protein